ncbi:MAG: hypothetical protein GY795_07795 [Desulfobacterales bacterium]|nr:hypothetical protein [Desulfobacterales bacterium]
MDAQQVIKKIEQTWVKVVDNNSLRIWKNKGKLISHLEGDDFCIGSACSSSCFKVLEQELGFELQ